MSVAPAQSHMAKSRRKDYDSAPSPRETTAPTMESDRVAQRAYELYLARGGSDGQDMDDWLSAERELLHSRASGSQES